MTTSSFNLDHDSSWLATPIILLYPAKHNNPTAVIMNYSLDSCYIDTTLCPYPLGTLFTVYSPIYMKVIYCMQTSLLLYFYIIHIIYIVMYHHMVTLGDITMHTNEFLVTLTHYDGNPCIFPPMIFTSTIWAMQETVKRTSTIAVVQ